MSQRKRKSRRKRIIRARNDLIRRVRQSPVGEHIAERSRLRRSLAALREAGVFDEAFYRSQAGAALAPDDDPMEHYLQVGSAEGWSPHPLFDRAYYLQHSQRAAESAGDPFVEFVTRGVHRGDNPHSLFDTKLHVSRYPESTDHRLGAWGHFLDSPDAPWPHRDFEAIDAPEHRGSQTFVAAVAEATSRHANVPDYTDFERVMDTFDHQRAASFVRDMAQVVAKLDDHPLISVIIPTKDRAAAVTDAIRSVQAQTYDNWELIVIDDGGSDNTDRIVRQIAEEDARISYAHQRNTGVAGARNHGIRRSQGELLAFLDSDNTWVPEFLETMVGFLASEDLQAAYCASELRSDEKVQYRGRPLNVDALRERNYIDCITIVMHRTLVPELSGQVFDERLRRVVDWDLLIRLSEVTALGYAPFIGTSYDLWDETGDRVSHRESVGYRHVVRNKHLVDFAAAPQIERGIVSIVMSIRGPGDKHLSTLLRRLSDLRKSDLNHELVLVDQGLAQPHALRLRLLEAAFDNVSVHRLADPATDSVGRNLAASRARGDVLLICDPSFSLAPRDIGELAGLVRADSPVILQPSIIDDGGTIRSTGQFLGPASSAIVAGFGHAEHDPAVHRVAERDGPDGLGFAVDAGSYRRLEGLDPLFVRGGGDLDLGLRGQDRGIQTRAVPLSAFLVPKPKNSFGSPELFDRAEFVRRWRDRDPRPLDGLGLGASVDGVAALPTEPPGSPRRWSAIVGRPVLGPRRWAIKTSVPDPFVRDTWGDWHFACALRDALQQLGEDAVVDLRPAWDRPTHQLDDVNIVIRGTQRFEPIPGKINVLWIISHPEKLTQYEVEQYDAVFVASYDYAAGLRSRWPRVDARPLLQCTDPNRFFPEYAEDAKSDVLFVGNSRGLLRTVVADAISSGLDPDVYGSDWEDLIPPEFVKGRYLGNEFLRRHYASAGAVLNDHWEDMRRWGFVSNRLFDVVASGGVVVTDPVEGVEDLFEDHVVVYREQDELAAAVEEARSRPHGDDDTVQRILREHTFEARAKTLLTAVKDIESESGRAPVDTHVKRQGRTTSLTKTVDVGDETPPPVFVGGTGRSGTTVMGQLIGASAAYAMIPVEVRFHADAGGVADLIGGQIDLEQFERAVMHEWYYRKPNEEGPRGLHVVASWTQLEEALARLRSTPRGRRVEAVGEFMHDLLDPVAERLGKRSWVEMTPPSVKVAHDLITALPSARFIHMVRDGRDVATSVAQELWGPDDVLTGISWWAEELIAISRSLAAIPNDNLLEIRLESLVGDNREEVWSRLCEFLGLDDTIQMREFFDTHVTREKARPGRWMQDLDETAKSAVMERYTRELERLDEHGVVIPDV